MAELGAYLERAAAKPMVWGEHDCMLFPAGWLLEVTGQDPAAAWRGHYATERGARLILGREGGMAALMGRGATLVGAKPVNPQRAPAGAVGIVLVPTAYGVQHAGAIRTSLGWAVLSDEGVTVHQMPALHAWAVI